ncbi:MAG: LemA family protein [Candidatus Woesebacteria bacterium GW2011_GWB1_45_5]|uniref:LemA family protein n=1 Tax=Candidatus Woesebacteria bacterium GW2011_GWB1_45_5 TaxID=1618581 RepID=A0A0G1MM10_9BACT|nr:MAG: LemA family protein [Candidatus Woesebacteria bacterium GW2011_GWB1_45_5]
MIYLYIALGVIALWVIATYNFFVSAKARVKAAIQEIGNQLKRQADLIPNLENSVKGYLTHEKGIFNELSAARKLVASAAKSGSLAKMADAGKAFSDVLPKLQVVVEDNPELKGNEVVENLMDELRDTSDKVMYARRLLIDLSADYNVKRATFPSSILAGMFNFSEMKGLETPEDGEAFSVRKEEMKSPKVNI